MIKDFKSHDPTYNKVVPIQATLSMPVYKYIIIQKDRDAGGPNAL